jgi:hypothetical protein
MLLVLVLQSAAVVASSALLSTSMQADCAETMNEGDRDCCQDRCATPASCVGFCAVLSAPAQISIHFPYSRSTDSLAFIARDALDPEQAPPNPPPIS